MDALAVWVGMITSFGRVPLLVVPLRCYLGVRCVCPSVIVWTRRLSVFPSVRLYVTLRLSVCLVCLCAAICSTSCLSVLIIKAVCLSVTYALSDCPSASVRPPVCQSVRRPVLSACLLVYLSSRLSVCLPGCTGGVCWHFKHKAAAVSIPAKTYQVLRLFCAASRFALPCAVYNVQKRRIRVDVHINTPIAPRTHHRYRSISAAFSKHDRYIEPVDIKPVDKSYSYCCLLRCVRTPCVS